MMADIILQNPTQCKDAKLATRVSEKTRIVLWARASGRCQFRGCNQSLIGDLIAGNEDANFGFVAHVVADKPGGPRGDPVRSPLLRDSVARQPEPHNDIVKSPADLARFRTLMRKTFNAIKRIHGEHAMIHVFAASPVSLSVEMGRVWMPKADLPLILYDQNRKLGGFYEALRIGPNC